MRTNTVCELNLTNYTHFTLLQKKKWWNSVFSENIITLNVLNNSNTLCNQLSSNQPSPREAWRRLAHKNYCLRQWATGRRTLVFNWDGEI